MHVIVKWLELGHNFSLLAGLCQDVALVGGSTDYCVCEGVRRQFRPNNNGRAARGDRSSEVAESEQKYGGMDQQSRKGHGLGGKIQSGEDARQGWRHRQNIQLFPGVSCRGHSRGISKINRANVAFYLNSNM